MTLLYQLKGGFESQLAGQIWLLIEIQSQFDLCFIYSIPLSDRYRFRSRHTAFHPTAFQCYPSIHHISPAQNPYTRSTVTHLPYSPQYPHLFEIGRLWLPSGGESNERRRKLLKGRVHRSNRTRGRSNESRSA